jgi:hypothetical protein
VLGAIEFAPGGSIVERIKHVSGIVFTAENDQRFQFTWRTIQTWYSRYKRDGVTSMHPKARSDKGLPRKMQPVELAEAIDQVHPRFHGAPRNVSAVYRACIERGVLGRERVAPNTFRPRPLARHAGAPVRRQPGRDHAVAARLLRAPLCDVSSVAKTAQISRKCTSGRFATSAGSRRRALPSASDDRRKYHHAEQLFGCHPGRCSDFLRRQFRHRLRPHFGRQHVTPRPSCTRGEAVGMEIGLRVLDRALRTVTWLLLRAALVVEDLRRKLPRRGRRWRRGLRGFVNRWQARNARPPAVFFRRRSASNRTPEHVEDQIVRLHVDQPLLGAGQLRRLAERVLGFLCLPRDLSPNLDPQARFHLGAAAAEAPP